MTKKKKKIIIIFVLLGLIIGAVYVGVNLFVDSMIQKTTIEEIKPEEIVVVEDETPKAHEVVNFMLVGADNLDYAIGRENSYREERSDVFKLFSLDYTDKKIKITSLDRDIVVWIPDKGGVGAFGRFNWAYSFGGSKYAINCINYNLDLDVSKFVSFSFAGFIDVIDILGGVDIELSQAEANVLNSGKTTMTAQEGMNHLDGFTALNYSRIRHLDSDFVRMERQNNVIMAVIDKLKNSSFTELFEVAKACFPYITTNLTTGEIKNYLQDMIGFDLNDIKTYVFPKNGYKDTCINPDSMGGYLLDSYSNQVIELHKYIYDTETYEPTQTIYDNEKKIYETYGNFYEGSPLIP